MSTPLPSIDSLVNKTTPLLIYLIYLEKFISQTLQEVVIFTK